MSVVSAQRVAPSASRQLLLIEDDQSDAMLMETMLERTQPNNFIITHAPSLEEAMMQMYTRKFDIALLDFALPGSSHFEALASLRHHDPQLPVVIVTGHDDEALALKAMQHGAQDYLVKEKADGHVVSRAIQYAIERKGFEESITQLANYDPLTGLANRSLFESRLSSALSRAKRTGGKPAVFFLDLDGFKNVNDRLGHAAGDAVLSAVAERLKRCLRDYDTIARFGGDEFALLMESDGEPRNCAIVAGKIIETISHPFSIDAHHEVAVGVSIGIANDPADHTLEQFLHHADTAMYRAKQLPGSNYQFYTDHLHHEAEQRLQLEKELMDAFTTKDQFSLRYQPKIAMESGALSGAEALIRWQHPTRGEMAPGAFLPLLSPSRALELDRWVVQTALRDIRYWLAAGQLPSRISLHIGNSLWGNECAMEMLLTQLREAGLEPGTLAVEIDEATLLNHAAEMRTPLQRLHDTGIELHLDNFGGGLSSLKLLMHCPLSALKIDRHLMQRIDSDAQEALVVRAMIDLGHTLGMKIVAEGVETQAQQDALSAMECDELQGLVISRPLTAVDFLNWMINKVAGE